MLDNELKEVVDSAKNLGTLKEEKFEIEMTIFVEKVSRLLELDLEDEHLLILMDSITKAAINTSVQGNSELFFLLRRHVALLDKCKRSEAVRFVSMALVEPRYGYLKRIVGLNDYSTS